LAPLVEQLLRVRERFRQQKQFDAADAIRDSLQRANIIIEDTKKGSRWRLGS
jgi:cysteinyl-tRNA synthetase